MRTKVLSPSLIFALALLFAANLSSRGQAPPNTAKAAAADDQAAVLVGAGDIADCGDLAGAEGTAALLGRMPGTIFAAGDLAYPDGSADQFAKCYGPTWGRYKDRTRPSPGNHEFRSGGATPYFDYFGLAAGDPSKGYYSYDLGSWHVIALNSNCPDLPHGCSVGSPEEQWLRQDLAQHSAACTVAYFHHPLFSSGRRHGNDTAVRPFWQALYDANADVVLNGHDHDYERFAPQDPDGRPNPARGIREFVVGTGGKNSHRDFGSPKPNSEVRNSDFGVLKLTLHSRSYGWEFIALAGSSFHDAGSGMCH